MSPRGFPVVLSSPSGGGKTTIGEAVMKELPYLVRSRSTTTRAPRGSEVNGVDYDFVSPERFDSLVAESAMVEWAEVHGNRYGTSRAFVEATCAAGQCPLLIIDVQGGRSLRRAVPESLLIFLMPPSLAEVERRLRSRATESEAALEVRLRNAKGEIAASPEYDYTVVSDALGLAISQTRDLIQSEFARRTLTQGDPHETK